MSASDHIPAQPRPQRRAAVAAALAVVAAFAGASAMAETPKTPPTPEKPQWFLLRQEKTGDCWPARLISIDGAYQYHPALKAGGPYDQKAEAVARERKLEAEGVCVAPA